MVSVLNANVSFIFRFKKVFDQNTQQDEIFEHVAKSVADR